MISNLIEFLEARIAEEEARADYVRQYGDWGGLFKPPRVLAECAAKWAILEMHGPLRDEGWISGKDHDYLWCGSCGTLDDSPEPFPCDTLKALAAVYSDHPDYQQEWAP